MWLVGALINVVGRHPQKCYNRRTVVLRYWTKGLRATILVERLAGPNGSVWERARNGRIMYQKLTNSVEITVQPFYLDEQSEPDKGHYVWGYHVTIHNQSSVTVQLLNRYWQITDGLGQIQEVRGPGVVGEQPILAPGESFEYTSGCPLSTSSGIMAGFYEMEVDGGERFEAVIPTFSLDDPNQQVRLN